MEPLPRTKRKPVEQEVVDQQRTAIYCRVSTNRQDKNDLSLPEQEDRCRKYCEAKALKVVGVYQDVASGRNLDRPELQKMLLSASRKEIDGIVCIKLDRLSRNPRDYYNLFEDLQSQNIALSAVAESLDTTTAVGRMIVGILLQFASFERELGEERTRAAMRQLAKQGRTGGSVAPLGYDKINKELLKNEDEAAIVRMIFELYLRGEGSTSISKELNKNGYRTKYHKRKNGHVGGKEFTKQNIHSIITNPLYKGFLHNCGDPVPGNHEEIVSDQDWQKAQRFVALNADQKNLGKSQRDRYLLTGITRCGVCGELMIVRSGTSKSGARYDYYQCISSTRPQQKRCKNGSANTKDLEAIIIDLIAQIASSDEFTISVLEYLNRIIDETDVSQVRREIGRLNAHLREIQITVDSLTDTISTANRTTRQPLLKKLEKQQQKKERLQSQIIASTDELNNLSSGIPNLETLRSVYSEFMEVWNELSQADRRNIIQLLVYKIEVTLDRATKKGNISVTLYHDFPVTPLTQFKMGSYRCKVLLRGNDKVKNPIPISISMRNILNNHDFTPGHQFTVKDGKLTVLVPISPNSRNRCEPRTHRLTISERREFEKQKKEVRFEEYIRLLERHEWSRAQLAKYLGVSRAWVSTVLKTR